MKTDARDALVIAQCLSYGGYHAAVYIPTQQDDSVKEYLRMRDDHKDVLKKIKQQINSMCLRHGHHYEGTKWTTKHVTWLRKLELSPLYRETLDEYMASFDEQTAKIERFDLRIEELASQEHYWEKVKKLCCFLGIKTHTVLSLIVETGGGQPFCKRKHICSISGAGSRRTFEWGEYKQDRYFQGGEQTSERTPGRSITWNM